MKKNFRLGLGAVALLAACAGTASATPLRMDYCVDVLSSGRYQYTFTLTLDNHDNTWAAGQGWRWLIFGDQSGAPSPLTTWTDAGTVWPVGPWTGFSSSGGGHNGPTMNYVLDYWVPNGVGEQLTWTGTSDANLQEPDVLFSTIAGTLAGGVAADFEVAHRLPSCAGQIVGACCRTSGSCFLTTGGNCTAIGGIYRGDNTVCATANCPQPPTGACCLPDLVTCTITYVQNCTAQGGTYRGDNTACATANCPTPGACCLSDGTCSQTTGAGCTAAGGTYHGNSTSCSTANCPQPPFRMNCAIPGTFTDISATGSVLVFGNPDDATSAFTSSVTNALVTNPNLFACTNGFISDSGAFNDYINTVLPHIASGVNFGLYPNWNDLYDDAPAAILHQAVVEGGVNVEVIEWSQVDDCCGGNPRGTFEVKIFGPGGPALVQFLYQGMAWDNNGANSTVGFQWGPSSGITSSYNTAGSIPDNAVCSIVAVGASACYANCDHSTTNPCLNVLDFGCFLNAFAAGDPYANCDHSTTNPVLNVLDFGCFLNQFAAGCSSC